MVINQTDTNPIDEHNLDKNETSSIVYGIYYMQ